MRTEPPFRNFMHYLILVVQSLASILYLILGLFMLFKHESLERIFQGYSNSNFFYLFGGLLVVYGIFRIVRLFKKEE